MKVEITAEAFADIERLELWLSDKDPKAAQRVAPALLDMIGSLASFPARGARIAGDDVRQVVVRFGSLGYIVRYVIGEDLVLVTHIHHAREDR